MMSRKAQTPAELIRANGGPHAMARALRTSPGAVRMWVQRNAIPRTAWPEIIEAFPKITLDTLRQVEAQPTDKAA